MSDNTWQTYDWQKHNITHYVDEQTFYAPLLVSQSRIGLMRTYTSNKWRLPIGSSLRDNEKREDAVMRAFYRMFDENKLKALISDSCDIGDSGFTCDISEHNYSVDAVVYSSYEWTENELNEHIAQCIRLGERPRWNKPGLTDVCTDYHVVNVGNNTESISRMVIGYVKELAFFTKQEVDIMHSDGTLGSDDWSAIDDYFLSINPYINMQSSNGRTHRRNHRQVQRRMHTGSDKDEYSPIQEDSPENLKWSNSSTDAFHMACAFLALEVALALYVCASVYG